MIKIPHFRWWIAFLLFIATGLSFFDRQVLAILAPAIMRDLRLTDVLYSHAVFAFILSYTVMFTVGGRLIDRLGLRIGLALAVTVWSLASLGHSLVHNAWQLGLALFFLGAGEGGCFPGATKGAVEWFPEKERSAAIGLAIGGASFGAVVAPPLIVWVNSIFGWRGAFVVAGAIGFVWLLIWGVFFTLPERSRFLSARELDYITAKEGGKPLPPGALPPRSRSGLLPLGTLLRRKETWGLMIARFLLDPVFYFYMFWIPQFLSEAKHVPLATIGRLTWIPFLTLGMSQLAGGWVSDQLVKRGVAVGTARKTVMGLAALLTPFSIFSLLAARPASCHLPDEHFDVRSRILDYQLYYYDQRSVSRAERGDCGRPMRVSGRPGRHSLHFGHWLVGATRSLPRAFHCLRRHVPDRVCPYTRDGAKGSTPALRAFAAG